MGKPRTAGVVAVKRDRVTRDTHVLFVSLRWTRSGFKTLMHCLNGAEKATRGAGATKNCTDEELAFFLGEGDDGAAERLWNDPLVPASWTRDRERTALSPRAPTSPASPSWRDASVNAEPPEVGACATNCRGARSRCPRASWTPARPLGQRP